VYNIVLAVSIRMATDAEGINSSLHNSLAISAENRSCEKRKISTWDIGKENVGPEETVKDFDEQKEASSELSHCTINPPTQVRDSLQLVYRTILQKTDLLFGVDKDIEDLPQKRIRKAPSHPSGAEMLQKRKDSTPATVSAGYGEISMGGFKHVLNCLQHEVDPELRLNENSSFIDIGSGFGKCVFHAKIQANVRRSAGIEYVHIRHDKAMEVLSHLQKEVRLGRTKMDLSGLDFQQGDATKVRRYDFTHIYCYDYIFNEMTHAALLPIIERSPFFLFVCFSPPSKLRKFGLESFELLRKIPVQTTGKQCFTAYIYKKNALAKLQSIFA